MFHGDRAGPRETRESCMTWSTVQHQPGQHKSQRQLKFIGRSGQGVLAQAGVASWNTGTEGWKTE